MQEYTVNGTTFPVIRQGNNGHPILGINGYSTDWNNAETGLLEMLGIHHELHLLNFVGLNNTRGKRPTSIEACVELVVDYIKDHGWDSVHIMGHSTGGSIAYLVQDALNDVAVPAVVGCNPLDYTTHNHATFLAAAFNVAGHDTVATSSMRRYTLKLVPSFARAQLRNPLDCTRLISSIKNWTWNIKPYTDEKRKYVIAGEDDYLFGYGEETQQRLAELGIPFEWVEGSHNWIMTHGEDAADRILKKLYNTQNT